MSADPIPHSGFSDAGVLDLAREVRTTVYKMANGVVLDREHTLIRADLDELAAGYLRLFEQYETLHRAALALLESADDQEHPDDGFPIAEWLDLVEAVRASSPEISPQDAGLEPIETDWAFKKESAPAKSQVPPPPIAKRGGWQPTARGPAPTEPPPKPSNPAISPEEQT